MTLIRMTPRERLADIAARGIAYLAVALFWWIWLTVSLGLVLAVAESRSLDASPTAVLAGAAVAATILFAVGLFLMNAVFTVTHTRAGVAVAYLAAHWRKVAAVPLVIAAVLVVMFGMLFGFAAILYGYAFAAWSSMQLTIQAAEQIQLLAPNLSFDAATSVVGAFVRVYVAATIVAGSIALTYLSVRQLLRGNPSQRGSA